MKIIMQKQGKTVLHLRIPLRLLINHVTASIAAGAMGKRGVNVTREQLLMIAKEIRAVRLRHPDWMLAEIEDGSGETLRIEL